MKKLFFALCALFYVASAYSQAHLIIAGKEYTVDTLQHFTAGPGTTHTYLNFSHPTAPLRVSFLEIDATNPYIRFESVTSNDVIIGTERPSAMAKRKTKNGSTFFAGINGDFFNTSAPYVGTPTNGFITDGEVGLMPGSGRAAMGITKDNFPITRNMAFKGKVTNASGEDFTINNINTARSANKLALYNSFNGATTKTDDTGTEVLVSVENDTWSVSSGTLKATVIAKNENKGSTAISKKQAVLSGTGTAQTYLNKLNAGDQIQIEMSIYVPSESNQQYKLSELVGGDQLILKDGAWTN